MIIEKKTNDVLNVKKTKTENDE